MPKRINSTVTPKRINLIVASKSVNSTVTFECINCGNSPCELHHVIPLALGGNDIDTNKVPLCSKCHAVVHGANPTRRGTHWRELQKAGIEKAKAEGKFKGRPPQNEKKRQFVELLPLNIAGERTATSIFKELEISACTFYRWKKEYEEKGEMFGNAK